MWANAQRDGRPSEYRWRPLFNAAKFGWRPLLECRAVTQLGRETRWNLQGCPKLPNRSQPLVAEVHHITRTCGRGIDTQQVFFPVVDICLSLRRYSPTNLCDGAEMAIFLRPVFPASCAQHVSDLHPNSALGPHHVWKYGRDPICDGWD